MKLKFVNLNNNDLIDNPSSDLKGKTYLNPGYYMLKTYFEFKSKNKNIVQWLDPIFVPFDADDIIEEIISEKVDILCLSLFVWSRDILYHVAKKVKIANPNVIVIIGGASVDAHKNPDFFKEHSYIDYVVYGDGEEALVEILDSIIEKRGLSDTACNIVTKDKVYPHKIFSDLEFNSVSSILERKEDVKRDVNKLKSYGFTGINFSWEMARGCPYKCSFCDWSGGLHNKVKRKEIDWKGELDFLYSLGDIRVTPTDANVGIYKEDLEITQYAANKGAYFIQNVAKLNKDRAYEVYKILLRSKYNKSQFIKISLQDIHEDVLAGINRPEIPWEEHKELIKNFKREFPLTDITGELIVGLPYQTVDKFVNQLQELRSVGINRLFVHMLELIPNSPMYKQEYLDKYNIKSKKITVLRKAFKTIDEVKQAYNQKKHGWYVSDYVVENNTLNFKDILTIAALGAVYSSYSISHNGIALPLRNKNLTDRMVKNIIDIIDENMDTINETNILAFHNKFRNRYEFIEMFFADPQIISMIMKE